MKALGIAAFSLVIVLAVFLGTLFYKRYDEAVMALSDANTQIGEMQAKLERLESVRQKLLVDSEKNLTELQTRLGEASDQADAARREKDRLYHDIDLKLNELTRQYRELLARQAPDAGVNQPSEAKSPELAPRPGPEAPAPEKPASEKLLMDKSELPRGAIPSPDKERAKLEKQGNKSQP